MANPKFDPRIQNVSFPQADGGQINVRVSDIDFWRVYAVKSAISFGAQFGACLISLLLLLALTPPNKKKTKIFFLYNASLVLNMVRLVCRMVNFTSNPVNEFYNYFTDGPTPLPTFAKAIPIVEVLGFTILLACVEVILTYQTWILYDNIRGQRRLALVGFLALVGLSSVVVRLIFSALNIHTILQGAQPPSIQWQKGTLAIMIASIGLFTLAFCGKLLVSWASRKRMGLQWGAMQWLFWASFESLLIPLVLAIMAPYADETFPEPEYAVLTAVVVLIPMGSLSATASMYNPRPSKATSGASVSHLLSETAYTSGSEALLNAPLTSYAMSTRSASLPQPSPTAIFDRELDRIDRMDDQGQHRKDVEFGIHVVNDYAVRTDSLGEVPAR